MTKLNVPDQHIFIDPTEPTHKRSRDCQCGPRIIYARTRPYVAHRRLTSNLGETTYRTPLKVFDSAAAAKRLEARMLRYAAALWRREWIAKLIDKWVRKLLRLEPIA